MCNQKIKRREEEINEKLARDMERKMRSEEAKAEKEKDQKGGASGGSPHRRQGIMMTQIRGKEPRAREAWRLRPKRVIRRSFILTLI